MKNRNYNDDVLFVEDCIDELFLDIGLEADRRRLAAMAKQLTVQNAHEATNL